MGSDPYQQHFTTHRPVAVLMVFLAAVVFGYFSIQRLPVNLMPELNYPTLTIRTEYPGAAPEEVENEISRPVEEAVGVVGGLSRISSISRAGISDVVMEFVWGTDMSEATQNTLEKLDLVFLPEEAERPLILHFDPALDPIMELSFSGTGSRFQGEDGLRRLRRIAELQIKRALEPIKGVAAVRVRGGLEEEFHVLLDKNSLIRSGLSIQNVIDRLRQENINIAGGSIKEGRAEYMVRTLNEFENLNQIADTVVRRFNGKDLRVRDLGRVVRAHREREIITRTDGSESVQVDIYKEADANMVAVAKAVIAQIGNIGEPTPSRWSFRRAPPPPESMAQRLFREEGARLAVVADRSVFIENSIKEVRNTAIQGGLLAVAVLFLFLNNFRSTAIIAVSIPMSILITFAPFNLFGVSLNVMSLGGLALGIGMLVDSSIVVLESIFRCREEGDDIVRAAIRGTAEVKGAVWSSTLTTVAVFFPMVFVEGIAGQVFGDLALSVVISLLASQFVALYFIPMLASRREFQRRNAESESVRFWPFLSWTEFGRFRSRITPRNRWFLWPYAVLYLVIGAVLEAIGKLILLTISGIAAALKKGLFPLAKAAGRSLIGIPMRFLSHGTNRLIQSYPKSIEWALNHPIPMAGIILLSFAITWFVGRELDTELLPEVHQGEFTIEADLPVGTPLEETARILDHIEAAIRANQTDIRSLIVTFGFDVTNIKRSDEGEHSARFKILLQPTANPARTEEQVLGRLRELFVNIPDLDVRVVRPVLFSSKPPIVVEIHGDDLALLKRTAQQTTAALAQLPQLTDVETTLRSGAPEIQVIYHRDRLVWYDLNLSTVASQVRNMVKGFEATRFNMKDRRIPILVRLEEGDREYINDIGRLAINPGADQPIPLNAIADLKIGEGPSEIRRVDRKRVALVQANLATGSLSSAVAAIRNTLNRQTDWPPDMSYSITGQNEEWERSQGSLYLALGLSLFLVYAIMAAQFESLVQPLIIMLTVPLAFFGTVLGLHFMNISLSIVVFLGMIMLVGIVVNNAIVLLDYANTLRQRGLELRQAIVTAGAVRLRPILMTTGTTVLGLLPMAFGLGDGAEIRRPMALTVMFGLAASTVLTLVIIPTIYYLVARWQLRFAPSTVPKPPDILTTDSAIPGK